MNQDKIPQLDITRFESDHDQFMQDFGAAYKVWGFAAITGHGIESKLVKDALNCAARFFTLNPEQKSQYLGSAENNWSRGYVPVGKEKAKGAEHSDLKEFYHIGRELADERRFPSNIWPSEIAEFEPTINALYCQLDQLGLRLLSAFAVLLNLQTNHFDLPVKMGEGLLRILHYPPILDAGAPNVRAAAHEDINLLTLLVGSEQAGLEVLSRQGRWVPIDIIDGSIICNVGDMLQRLSNKTLPSTTHRVVNPQGDAATQSRYSIPFFLHPEPSMPLDCLAQCVSDASPAHFEPITAGEYHAQRLSEIGLQK